MFNILLQQMYSDRRGNDQKPPWTKPSRQRQEPSGQKPLWTIEREFVQGAFVHVFCTRPTKNRGVRVVWRTFGEGPGMCDRGGGGQNWPKIVWRTLWTAPWWKWCFLDWNKRWIWEKDFCLICVALMKMMPPEIEAGLIIVPGPVPWISRRKRQRKTNKNMDG